MKVGYSERCTICNSKYRADVEKWSAVEGLSIRAITQRLADDYGFVIGPKSVWRHLKNHFNVDAETLSRYSESPDYTPPEPGSEADDQLRQSRNFMDDTAKKRLEDIKKLDEVAEINFNIHKKTGDKIKQLMKLAKGKKSKVTIPRTLVDLHSTSSSEMRQALKAKMDILKVNTPEKDSDVIRTTLVDLIMSLGD
ncbi:MAG: hypothetical protein WDA47_03750 [Bacilli bacterium]